MYIQRTDSLTHDGSVSQMMVVRRCSNSLHLLLKLLSPGPFLLLVTAPLIAALLLKLCFSQLFLPQNSQLWHFTVSIPARNIA